MSDAQWSALLGDLSAAQFLMWVGAGIALIVLLVKAWPKIRKFVDTIDALGGLPETLDRVDHELTTNHGSSLKDAVQRLEKKLDDHVAKCERGCGSV